MYKNCLKIFNMYLAANFILGRKEYPKILVARFLPLNVALASYYISPKVSAILGLSFGIGTKPK